MGAKDSSAQTQTLSPTKRPYTKGNLLSFAQSQTSLLGEK